MDKDAAEKKQDPQKEDQEKPVKRNKEWKDIINLPDDLESEIH